jgi:hypothetical protein
VKIEGERGKREKKKRLSKPCHGCVAQLIPVIQKKIIIEAQRR